MIGTTRVFSRTRVVRWFLWVSVLSLCLGVVLLGFDNQREDLTLSPKRGAIASLQEFRTTFHADGRPQFHISGDSLSVSKTRLMGPFRLGFMHTLKGRNIAVEIIDMAEFEEARHTDASAFSPQHILSRLVPQQTLGGISRIDLQTVSLRLNRGEQFFLSLSADRAWVKLGNPKVKLRGQVTLRSHTGEQLSAEEMLWDQKNNILEVEGTYAVAKPHAEQRGAHASFRVDRNGALRRYFRNSGMALGETP